MSALLGVEPHCWGCACRVPAGTVAVVLSYCHNSLHDTSLLKVSCTHWLAAFSCFPGSL